MSSEVKDRAGQFEGTGAALAARYREVRGLSEALCQPLEVEDYVVQSMPDASPARWHLAHTTWFFETFLLGVHVPGFQPFHPAYSFLFNSYYNAVGERWPRPARGALSRPTVREVYDYRHATDERVLDLLESRAEILPALAATLELGLHHEQQHQELLLTDLKHAFASNPLRPPYRKRAPTEARSNWPASWISYPAGLHWLGQDGTAFAFDNEKPRHRVFIEGFQIAARLVTAAEYTTFMEDGGYVRPELWLSDGWQACLRHGWQAPLYWEQRDDRWWQMTLDGLRPVAADEPVCHVSYYEADAFARWAGSRLPTEAEWETAADCCPVEGNFLDSDHLHPVPAGSAGQFFGDAWEWTASPYVAYPGYRPLAGALGEYNGKFMCNTLVLRGGSCVTPPLHIRPTYRNFFPPETRWQFSGIRLASNS